MYNMDKLGTLYVGSKIYAGNIQNTYKVIKTKKVGDSSTLLTSKN